MHLIQKRKSKYGTMLTIRHDKRVVRGDVRTPGGVRSVGGSGGVSPLTQPHPHLPR